MDFISNYLSRIVGKILENANPNSWLLDINIFSYKNDKFNVRPFLIDKLDITQLFYLNVTDEIRLQAQLLPDDLYSIIDNLEDLGCRIVFKPIEHDTVDIILDKEFITREYKLHIPDLADLNKKFSKHQLRPEPDEEAYLEQHHGVIIPIIFQLLPTEQYIYRKRSLNVVFQQTSIKQVVLFVCAKLGCTKLKYAKDMHDTVYQNINIPPKYGSFKRIFGYLQERYGIYKEGFTYYFFNSFLYLYPAFSTEIDINEPILRIYKLPQNHLGNTRKYHAYIENDLYILVDSAIEYTDAIRASLENEGTNHLITKSDTFIDNSRIVNENSTEILNNTINLSISDNLDRVQKDAVSIKYDRASIHGFEQTTAIAEKSTIVLSVIWKFAVPYSIYPGQFVKFYYEKDDTVVEHSGRVENIIYSISRIQQTYTTDPVVGVIAKLQLRLSNIL